MWITWASGPSNLTIALIAAGAALLGAIVAGTGKYLADPRLEESKLRAEGRIAARLVHDDLIAASTATSLARSRIGSITLSLDLLVSKARFVTDWGEQAQRDVQRSFQDLAPRVREVVALQIATPAWDEHRTALAAAMPGNDWIMVSHAITEFKTAKGEIDRLGPIADRLDKRTRTDELGLVEAGSKLNQQLSEVNSRLEWAAHWAPFG